jgi:hypothetical protein
MGKFVPRCPLPLKLIVPPGNFAVPLTLPVVALVRMSVELSVPTTAPACWPNWEKTQSMGSVGDCYVNAVCESFHATLEKELLRQGPLRTRQEARTAVFDWIEAWYNRERRHSRLGYRSPDQYERDQTRRTRTASISITTKNEKLPNHCDVSTKAGGFQ